MIKTTGSDEAFNEICNRYENVFYKICQKYAPALSVSGINPQDIFDEKNYIILHCVRSFNNRKKTKLSTWIGNYARYLCLNTLNSRKFVLPTSTDELNNYIEQTQQKDSYFRNNPAKTDDYAYVNNLLDQLKDGRIRDIIKLRYFSDQPVHTKKRRNKKMIWEKIARKLNMSTQTAINLHNKGMRLLKNKLQSSNISDQV